MKKIILLFLMAFAMSPVAWAVDSNKLHVKMDVAGLGDSIAVLHHGQQLFFAGKQGHFEFDIELTEVSEVIFVEPRALRGDMENIHVYRVPGVPGEEMHLTAKDDNRYDVMGSGFYAQYHQVDLWDESASADLRQFVASFNAMREAGVERDSLNRYYNDVYLPLLEKYRGTLLEYIKAHSSEEATATLVSSLGSLNQVNEAVQALSPAVREGRMKPLIDAAIADKMMEAQRAEEEAKAALKQAPGTLVPDFTLNDINSRPLRLSTLRGKYVILDFWGSWCVWCIKGFPKMKEYYEKYKGKFEIIGIACNDEEAKWKAAVNRHKLPWKHVICPDDSPVLIDYAIQGFPTKMILDPDGKIVKTIVGEDPSFYTLLDELFGK
ncbi:MAG: TlpA family protein disulfide reductase [Prevotella sp.]|nr:TlpA family protein disulfide reductase [Prevotella sp.]